MGDITFVVARFCVGRVNVYNKPLFLISSYQTVSVSLKFRTSLPIFEHFSDAEIKRSSLEFKIEIAIHMLIRNQKLVSIITTSRYLHTTVTR
jgi:hypothetical protein